MLTLLKIILFFISGLLSTLGVGLIAIIPIVIWIQVSKPLAILVLLFYLFIWYKRKDEK